MQRERTTEKIRDDTWTEGKKIRKRKEVDSLLINAE